MIGRRELRPEARPPTFRFRAPNVHLPLWLLGLGWSVVLGWRSLFWAAGHPRTTLVAGTTAALVVTDLFEPAAAALLLTIGALCLWWAFRPDSFAAVVGDPARLGLREWLIYRRNWQPAMLACGLSLREAWGGDLPVLRSVRDDAGRDVLRVRMLPGQTLERWTAAAPALAQTFGVRTVRVRRVPDRPQELSLVIARRNPQIRHVTESPPEEEARPVTPARGAFPRQPHGGAA